MPASSHTKCFLRGLADLPCKALSTFNEGGGGVMGGERERARVTANRWMAKIDAERNAFLLLLLLLLLLRLVTHFQAEQAGRRRRR